MTGRRPFRVLVTGSRAWRDEQTVRDALAAVTAEHRPENVVVVHGACPTGADRIADEWAATRNQSLAVPVAVERHPADWERFGRQAGPRRNAEMVALGASICLAFVDSCAKTTCKEPKPHGSHGASHTADLAEKAGILVCRYERSAGDSTSEASPCT